MLALLAAIAQFESNITSERIAEYRRLRGDKLGGAFFGEAEKVRDAFLAPGTLAGATRLLKRQGDKTNT